MLIALQKPAAHQTEGPSRVRVRFPPPSAFRGLNYSSESRGENAKTYI